MRSKKVLALLLTASMVVGSMFTGCKNDNNSKNDPGNKPVKVSEEGEKDDVSTDDKIDDDQFISIPVPSEPKTLDSCIATDYGSSRILTHVVEGLTRITQVDGKDKIVPGIAESWEASEDGLTWTFHLRDAKWSDGVPVTANDFEYAIKRVMNPETASQYTFILAPLKNAEKVTHGDLPVDELGVKALDDKTLQFKLDVATPYFLDLSYFKVMMPQRKDIVEKYGDIYGSEAEHIISNGAFILKTWNHDNEFQFEKNPNYWAADEVKLDRMSFKVIKDESARMNAMLSGLVDLGGVSQPDFMKRFDQTGDFKYISTITPFVMYFFFNQETRYFKNKNIRRAFQMALDREDFNKVFHRGSLIPSYSWVPPTVQINGVDFREKSGELPIKKVIEDYGNPKDVLIEGLKELGESTDPSDMAVTLTLPGTSDRDREKADYLVQKLQGVLGVKINIDAYEWGVFQMKTDNMEYELGNQGWIGDYNDPNTFLEMFMSTSNICKTGWNNPEYDKCIKDAAKELDPEKRFQLFKRAEEILLYDDAVISPTVISKTSTYQRNYVYNVARPLFGTLDLTRAYTKGR